MALLMHQFTQNLHTGLSPNTSLSHTTNQYLHLTQNLSLPTNPDQHISPNQSQPTGQGAHLTNPNRNTSQGTSPKSQAYTSQLRHMRRRRSMGHLTLRWRLRLHMSLQHPHTSQQLPHTSLQLPHTSQQHPHTSSLLTFPPMNTNLSSLRRTSTLSENLHMNLPCSTPDSTISPPSQCQIFPVWTNLNLMKMPGKKIPPTILQ